VRERGRVVGHDYTRPHTYEFVTIYNAGCFDPDAPNFTCRFVSSVVLPRHETVGYSNGLVLAPVPPQGRRRAARGGCSPMIHCNLGPCRSSGNRHDNGHRVQFQISHRANLWPGNFGHTSTVE